MKKISMLVLILSLLNLTFLRAMEEKMEDSNEEAKPSGLYIGIGGAGVTGDNNMKFKNFQFDSDNEWDDYGTTAKLNLFVGYNIMQYLAVEGELVLGTGTGTRTTNAPTFFRKDSFDFSESTFFINTIGKYNLSEKHTLFAKLGLGYTSQSIDMKTDIDYSNGSYTRGATGKQSLEGFTYKIGFGYEFSFNAKHALLVEYNYVNTPNASYEDSVSNRRYGASLNHSLIGVAYKFSL